MINRVLIFIASTVVFSACSHMTKTSNEKSSEDYTKNIRPNSIQKVKSAQCPKSQNELNSNLKWQELLKIANQCVKEKRWIMVESLGQLQLEKDPNSPWGSYYFSIASEMRGFLTQALWYAELSVKLAPQSALSHYQLGRLQWNSDQRKEAVSHFNKTIEIDPTFVPAQLFLGQLYYEERNYSSSRTHLLAALKQDPTSPRALEILAECHVLNNQPDEALMRIDQILAHHPGAKLAYLRRAQILEEFHQDPKMVLEAYRRAEKMFRKEKEHAEIQLKISKLEMEQKKLAETPKKMDRKPASSQGGTP